MAHFVILEKRSSNYEISMISLHHMLWAIRLFCQKCSILSFSESPCIFSLFNIVTKGPFCHFGIVEFKLWDIVYVQYVISIILLLQFCQKCSILSFSERPVYFFHFFNIVKNGPFCHFGKAVFKLWNKYDFSTPYVVSHQTILSKMLNFVIFWEARVFFHFSILSPKAIFSFWKSGIQIMR